MEKRFVRLASSNIVNMPRDTPCPCNGDYERRTEKCRQDCRDYATYLSQQQMRGYEIKND